MHNYDPSHTRHEMTPTHVNACSLRPTPTLLHSSLDIITNRYYPIPHLPSLGTFNIAVHPSWAPYGAERFLKMVEVKFFSSQIAMFRALSNFLVQVSSFVL